MCMKKLIFLIVLILILSACSHPEQKKSDLIVYSPYPERFLNPIIQDFEHATGQRVQVIHDSTRKLIQRIEHTEPSERGHVFLGGSLSELEGSKSIIQGKIHPFIYMPSILVVNKDLIGNIRVTGYKDLRQEKLYHRFSYPNPELTNTGYQHRNALESLYGDQHTKAILSRGIQVNKTAEVIENVISGRSYVGMSYEYTAMDYIDAGYPLKIVYPSDGTIINTDGIVKINGTTHPNRNEFIKYMLSKEVQLHISDTFHVKSARKDVPFKPYKILKPLEEINVIQKGE